MGKPQPVKSIGGITYTLTKPDGKVEFKKEKDGFIKIIGHDAVINLPKNSASKIRIGDSSIFNQTGNLEIIDGAETDGKKYSDQIDMKNGRCIKYLAAKNKNKSQKGGDVINVGDCRYVNITAFAGATVNVAPSNPDIVVEQPKDVVINADKGCTINNEAFDTKIKWLTN